MGRPEKRITGDGVAAGFAKELRKLRVEAGSPSYRDMARSALFSPSVLSSAASGTRLPTLQVTLGFVAACGGDQEVWRRRWLEVSGRPASEMQTCRAAAQAPYLGPPRPAQLPPRPRGFVGRTTELRHLAAAPSPLVLISGPAGIGKSDLAVHFAYQTAPDKADGQLHADLSPSGSAPAEAWHVLGGLLGALGVPAEQLPEALDQRAGLYRTLLSRLRLVVLLDNVRDERQVRPLLAETDHSITIVVSRNSLRGLRDVRRVQLDVLPRRDSIVMISAAVPDRAAAEPGECTRLAQLCGDLPLALDIALRKLAARPDLSLRHVTARLQRRGQALDWLRIGDLSVRESLYSTYEALAEPARALLRSIGGRLYPYDLGSTFHGHEDAFEELLTAGMLRRGDHPGGYRLQPLARAFAAELAPHQRTDMHRLTAESTRAS